MELKELLFKELIKNGYSERENGEKVWNVADRCLLYMSKDLADSFLKLRAHPRYRATIVNIEIELLKSFSKKFIDKIGETPCNLIDLGCGDGRKAKEFLGALNGKGKIRYCPVNVNKWLVNLALENIKGASFSNVVDYKPVLANCKSLYDVKLIAGSDKFPKTVALLLGSILSSYEIHEFLFSLSGAMDKGDCLIIGNAIRKGDRFSNIETYRDPLFQDWFAHLIREMGFDENEVEFDARFENGRVECFYRVRNDKGISYEGKNYEFNEGDEIVVAVLYKYYEEELEKFCKMYFREVELVKDEDEEQALICCIK